MVQKGEGDVIICTKKHVRVEVVPEHNIKDYGIIDSLPFGSGCMISVIL